MSQPSPLVVALVDTILVETPRSGGPVEDTARALERKIAGMPSFARIGMAVLLVVFDWSGLIRCGCRFRAQSRTQREAQLDAWRGSAVGPFRDFVSFFRRMGTFIWYSLGSEE